MASIGSYYVRVLPDMSGFTNGLVTGLGASGVGNAGTNTGRTFGQRFSSGLLGFIKRIAIGTTIGRIVTNGFNTIVGGFFSGIERLDIVENYPRILENLGIANEDAARSIQRLQDALLGLPTSLQDGVSATQRLTATFGDVDRGTDAFIAFNNALVAGMAPAALQSAALEQFSQAIAKGKPDMLEWRSMVNAMPAQMAQVAASFDMTTAELGEALRNGDLSMDEFVDAFIRLNEEGGEGFASFADQAHTATNTIGTAITNLGNRVAAGWAKIFEVFGQENIADTINGISTGILAGFTAVADALQWLIDELSASGIADSLASIGAAIADFLAPLGGEALTIVQEFATGAIQLLADVLQGVADNLPAVLDVFSEFGGVVAGAFEAIANVDFSPITDFINGDGESFNQMMERIQGHLADLQPYLDNVGSLWNAFMSAVANLVEAVAPIAVEFFAQLVSAIVGLAPIVMQIVSVFLMFGSVLLNVAAAVVSVVLPFLAELVSAVLGIAAIIVETVVAFGTNVVSIVASIVGNVIAFFANLPASLANIWGTIVSGVSTAWTNVRTFIVNAADAIRLNVTSAFNQLRNTVGTVWNNIKSAITTPINAARDAVSNAIERIKGFFSFKISWPHIPLPHFSVSGSANPLDWLTGGLPKFNISWYATGGMVDTPTVWLAGAGEKGAELVWPSYEPYMGKYAAAIAEHMDSTGTTINYYIDGNLVASDARLAAALDVVAERVGGRRRMGSVRA